MMWYAHKDQSDGGCKIPVESTNPMETYIGPTLCLWGQDACKGPIIYETRCVYKGPQDACTKKGWNKEHIRMYCGLGEWKVDCIQ